MEVKKVTYGQPPTVTVSGKQTSLRALPRVAPPSLPREAEPSSAENKTTSKAEAALKQVENLSDDVVRKAESINTYMIGLNGILDQGLKEGSEVRRQALEKEAKQIVRAIREKTANLNNREFNNIGADPLLSEVEAKIGRTLEMIFPEEGAGDALSNFNFNNKDLIIAVQTKILRASNYISSLRKQDEKKDSELKRILDKADTAQVNVESSQTSLRDVEGAFALVSETSKLIGIDPATALVAIGKVHEQLDVQG